MGELSVKVVGTVPEIRHSKEHWELAVLIVETLDLPFMWEFSVYKPGGDPSSKLWGELEDEALDCDWRLSRFKDALRASLSDQDYCHDDSREKALARGIANTRGMKFRELPKFFFVLNKVLGLYEANNGDTRKVQSSISQMALS